jgi:hypothetical protein
MNQAKQFQTRTIFVAGFFAIARRLCVAAGLLFIVICEGLRSTKRQESEAEFYVCTIS